MYLEDYIKDKRNKLFIECNAFFAFSDEQLNEALSKFEDKNIKHYCNKQAGLICLKSKSKYLDEQLDIIYETGINKDIADNTIEGVILRELANHEAYYTGDIESTVDSLGGYGVTFDDVMHIFRNKNYKILKS